MGHFLKTFRTTRTRKSSPALLLLAGAGLAALKLFDGIDNAADFSFDVQMPKSLPPSTWHMIVQLLMATAAAIILGALLFFFRARLGLSVRNSVTLAGLTGSLALLSAMPPLPPPAATAPQDFYYSDVEFDGVSSPPPMQPEPEAGAGA